MAMPGRPIRSDPPSRWHPYGRQEGASGDRSHGGSTSSIHRLDGPDRQHLPSHGQDGKHDGGRFRPSGTKRDLQQDGSATLATLPPPTPIPSRQLDGLPIGQPQGPSAAATAPAADLPIDCIEISADMNARTLARDLLASARQRRLPVLLTAGKKVINQAVKGIALTISELAKESKEAGGAGQAIDLTFQPAFRSVERNAPLIAFYLEPQGTKRPQGSEESTLTVAGHSKPNTVAGAIAGRVREGKAVRIVMIGVEAVANAVLAVGHARLFLERDMLDIRVKPELISIDKNGMAMNAMRFIIVTDHLV